MTLQLEIQNSLDRLQNAFRGNYGAYPLLEGNKAVGMLTFDKENRIIYVTYRGSIGSCLELLSCLCFWKKKWIEPDPHFKFKGEVHATLLNAFQKVKSCFQGPLDKMLKETKSSIQDWKFVVEGYSRGSALAMLTAFFLKQAFRPHSVRVFTYSTMKIFDENGAKSYEEELGKEHHSFLCKEDPFPRWLGPSVCGFRLAPRNHIVFNATGNPDYDKRVREKCYSYLHPLAQLFSRLPLIGWLFRKIIPPKSWEGHMPQTYRIASAHHSNS